ncbi:MAG: efflux RND transporter permease subunit [Steroidobacteraceae bacterium]
MSPRPAASVARVWAFRSNRVRAAAFAPIDLRRILTDVIDLYEPIAEDNRLTLRLELQETPTAEGDAELLFEAVANLVDNAIKFSPAATEVSVRLLRAPGGPCVRVADQGSGIAPEDWGQGTHRFFRADRSRHTPGNGLGLSLVAAIMRLHGFGLTLDAARRGCCIKLECWIGHAEDSATCVLSADESSRAVEERIAAVPYPVPMRVGPPQFNITAMMGMVMILGIGTEMAIFLASEYQLLEQQRGTSAHAALQGAALNRLRPITMSSLAMILALLPLGAAISGSGDQMLQPLAIAIMAGVLVQLPMVLLVMPVVIGLTIRRPESSSASWSG